MIQLLVNDQDLFQIIMALDAFEKTSAAPRVNYTGRGDCEQFLEMERHRCDLLERLREVFEEAVTVASRQAAWNPEMFSQRHSLPIQLEVNSQELFQMIMALHAAGELRPAGPYDCSPFDEIVFQRQHLLARLHEAFNEDGAAGLQLSACATESPANAR